MRDQEVILLNFPISHFLKSLAHSGLTWYLIQIPYARPDPKYFFNIRTRPEVEKSYPSDPGNNVIDEFASDDDGQTNKQKNIQKSHKKTSTGNDNCTLIKAKPSKC